MPYFKALNCNGGSPFGVPDLFLGKLPQGNEPGPWVTVDGELSVDKNAKNNDTGIFLCRNETDLVAWLADALFEIGPDDTLPILEKDGYTVAKKARLLCQLHAETWNEVSARTFAAVCAEHVLDLIPNGEQKEAAVAAIATAKQRAAASPTDTDAHDELETACDRAVEAALSLAGFSESASRAASAAAEAARGYVSGATAARNAAKFARLSKGESQDSEFEWQVEMFKATVQTT